MGTYRETHRWITFEVDTRTFTHELWVLIGEAYSKCEHLAGTPLQPETAEKLHLLYLAKGAHATTAIEGNTLSEEEVQQHIEGTLKLPTSRQYLAVEVQNILDACNNIVSSLQNTGDMGLSVEVANKFNELVLAGLELNDEVEPGKIRRHRVGVQRYLAPNPEDCPQLLAQLFDWLRSIRGDLDSVFVERPTASAFIRAILAHLYIAWIHPYGDGNGRTARLLEFAILVEAGVPSPAAHLFSNHYNHTREQYYRELDRASKSGGDIVPFMIYAMRGFVDGLREQIESVREQHMEVAWVNYVHKRFSEEKSTDARHRQKAVIIALSKLDNPIRIRHFRSLTPEIAELYSGKTGKTITRDFRVLLKLGLVVRAGPLGIRAYKEVVAAFLPARAPGPSKAPSPKTSD